MLRILIHLIRIRIQHFSLNTDPAPGFWWPKLFYKFTTEKKAHFWGSRTTIYLSLGLHKGRSSCKRSLQLWKENIQHFKTWNFLIFSAFVCHFWPPGSGSGFRIRIRIHWPDWILIQFGSGSASLVLYRTGPRAVAAALVQLFFYFGWSFLPSWIRIRIHWPDWIRIQFGSGSASLVLYRAGPRAVAAALVQIFFYFGGSFLHFCPPGSEYGSGSTDLIDSGSSSDPDPQPWFCIGLAPARSLLPSFSGPTAPQPVAPTAPQLSAAYQLPAALPVPLDNRYPYLSFKVYISGKWYLPLCDLLPENGAKVPTVKREPQKNFIVSLLINSPFLFVSELPVGVL